MNVSTILIANTIFLATILVLIVLIIEKKGNSKKPRASVKEDMNKIKEQISKA